MCGRFSRRMTTEEIAESFEAGQILCDLEPSYNVAPSQDVVAIINGEDKKLVTFKWGLIPYWSKDPSVGYKMINARAESISEKPSFKLPLKSKRCLIIADGFYEWRKEQGNKIPMFFHLKSHKPFGFAGLYDNWTSIDGEKISTCTIITTDANELMKQIHYRMPVILPKEKESIWIDSNIHDIDILLPILKPYDSNLMEMYEVSRFVNSPKNNSKECIQPIQLFSNKPAF
ncbi:MAG: SOS response-associated peptidase [Candidatus Cloacimonetes bacterium]|nr:SOS response-associated peptidase [Candidatus Cloacimonadota bacterium]